MVVLLVVLTEHILLGESCVIFFPVCFRWGLFMKLTDVSSKKDYYQFSNTILLFWFFLNEPDFIAVFHHLKG